MTIILCLEIPTVLSSNTIYNITSLDVEHDLCQLLKKRKFIHMIQNNVLAV